MLSEEVIEKVTERLINRIENTNTYILQEIGKSIKKVGTLTPSKAYQLEQILKYGGTYDKIVRQLVKMIGLTVQDILDIFDEVAKTDLNFAKKFYDYRGINFIPYEQNITLKNQVRALATITASEFANIANTTMLGYGLVDKKGNITYKGIRETYNDLIDEAILSVSQGKETFQSAMYRQIKTMGSGGLKVIYPTTYIDKDGNIKHYTRRLDSVIRSQMNQGLLQMHNEIQEQFGNEFSADGYEITVHGYPAIDHEDAQGRQFSKEEYNKLNNGEEAKDYKGKTYTLDHDYDGRYRQISTLNCRHVIFPIILGVSKPRKSDEELERIKNENEKGFEYEGKHYTLYEGTQLQRRLEAKIREQKDIQIMGRASNIMEDVEEAQKNISILTNKYKELCNISGLSTYLDRARVTGYKRVKTK